jgi:hypothetical protein
MTVIARRPWVAAVALCSIALAGCQTDHQAAGDRLVRDLSAKYPGQINAIEFKYAPPLDPPTLYIDLDASMDPQAQRRFLCEVLVPDMSVVDRDIAATVSYGWWSDDRPSPSAGGRSG